MQWLSKTPLLTPTPQLLVRNSRSAWWQDFRLGLHHGAQRNVCSGEKNLLETCVQDEIDAVWGNSGVANCCDQSRLSSEAIGACKGEADRLTTKVARYTTRQCPGSQTAFHQPIGVVSCKEKKNKWTGERSCTASGKATCCVNLCIGSSELDIEQATT